jgi:hypothetical protein
MGPVEGHVFALNRRLKAASILEIARRDLS